MSDSPNEVPIIGTDINVFANCRYPDAMGASVFPEISTSPLSAPSIFDTSAGKKGLAIARGNDNSWSFSCIAFVVSGW